MGLAYELAGRLNEATDQYRRAVELDPSDQKARKRLAAVRERQQLR